MVSVGAKDVTSRRATAEGFVLLSAEAISAISSGTVPKGDALAVARLAGIMAAKKTPDIIPLAHPVAITGMKVELTVEEGRVRIEATAETMDRTGVEMEALTAVGAAALALYDMVKAIDRAAVIEGVRLLAKSGGKSGQFRAQDRTT